MQRRNREPTITATDGGGKKPASTKLIWDIVGTSDGSNNRNRG